MRILTVVQRRRLFRLTAGSGCTENLAFIVTRLGWPLAEYVFCDAAKSGQLDACRWLRAHGCPFSSCQLEVAAEAGHLHILQWLWGRRAPLTKKVLWEAARNGHRHVCEWLLSCGCPWNEQAPAAAAHGGHVELAYELLDEQPTDVDYLQLLISAAAGCDLASMQGLIATVGERRREWRQRPPTRTASRMVAEAAASATPDWRAKVEWLQAQGYDDPSIATWTDWTAVASGTDPLGRLTWLLSNGWLDRGPEYQRHPQSGVDAFAAAGNIEAVQLLLAAAAAARLQGAPAEAGLAAAAGSVGSAAEEMEAAAAAGAPVEAADAVGAAEDEAGAAAGPGALAHCTSAVQPPASYLARVSILELEVTAVQAAARHGHLHVVSRLLESRGWHLLTEQRYSRSLLSAAAASGSVKLMAWLRDRGCSWDTKAFEAAAEAGCEAALEWLVEQGCPVPDSGRPYVLAARNDDGPTLRCLRRLGCPWGPRGRRGVIASILSNPCEPILYWQREVLPHLRWLAAEGCPLDCAAARRALPNGLAGVGPVYQEDTRNIQRWLCCERRRQRWRAARQA